MCNTACIDFLRKELRSEDVFGKSVLEVGSYNENGSIRPFVESLKPKEYIGADLKRGAGVDVICDVSKLITGFGINRFDVVISTEMLEHIQDWSRAISQMKLVLKPGGIIMLTTRSFGCPYHAFPLDFWRYEVDDIRKIFADFSIEAIEKDPLLPGVFVKAKKPDSFSANDLGGVTLWSMMLKKKVRKISSLEVFVFRCKAKIAQFF